MGETSETKFFEGGW